MTDFKVTKNERWRPIFEGRYEISDQGRCRSWVHRNGRRSKPHMLHPNISTRGYTYYDLSPDREQGARQMYAHRLVLDAFVGPCPNGHQSAHWNGNKTDNRVENLRWATPKENTADSVRHGAMPRGEKNGFSKLKESDVPKIRNLRSGGATNEALAEMFGVSTSAISQVCLRKTWEHVT